MSLLGWIVVGLLAGGLGRRVVGADKRGCLATMVIGVVGAFIGGALYRAVRGPDVDVLESFDIGSVLVATMGAIVLLAVLDVIGRGNRR